MTTLHIGYDASGGWYPRHEGVRVIRGLLYGVLFSLPIWFGLWLAARWIWRMM